jgi:hypothetical protein
LISVAGRYRLNVRWMILMVKIAAYKSAHWYENYCCWCDKKFTRTEPRVNGTATFTNDIKVNVLYHEGCAHEAKRRRAIEQIKRGEFGESLQL